MSDPGLPFAVASTNRKPCVMCHEGGASAVHPAGSVALNRSNGGQAVSGDVNLSPSGRSK